VSPLRSVVEEEYQRALFMLAWREIELLP